MPCTPSSHSLSAADTALSRAQPSANAPPDASLEDEAQRAALAPPAAHVAGGDGGQDEPHQKSIFLPDVSSESEVRL